MISAGVPREPAPPSGPPEALDEPGLGERAQLLLQEPQRDLLALGDLARRHERPLVAAWASSIIARIAYSSFCGDLQHGNLLLS